MAQDHTCVATFSLVDDDGAKSRVLLEYPAFAFMSGEALIMANAFRPILQAVTSCAITKMVLSLRTVMDEISPAPGSQVYKSASLIFEDSQGRYATVQIPGAKPGPDGYHVGGEDWESLIELLTNGYFVAPWQDEESEPGPNNNPLTTFVIGAVSYEENTTNRLSAG